MRHMGMRADKEVRQHVGARSVRRAVFPKGLTRRKQPCRGNALEGDEQLRQHAFDVGFGAQTRRPLGKHDFIGGERVASAARVETIDRLASAAIRAKGRLKR